MVYVDFLDSCGSRIRVGGVETYLATLSEMCLDVGWEPVLFQVSERHFERIVCGGLRVIGVPRPRRRRFQGMPTRLFRAALEHLDEKTDVLIFGTYRLSVRTSRINCISIQHGISWDVSPFLARRPHWYEYGPMPWFTRQLRGAQRMREWRRCPNRVCVDYNFLNWFRAVHEGRMDGRNWVIPNFAPRVDRNDLHRRSRQQEEVRVLFARRFFPYRGTRILAEAASRLLPLFPHVRFTFCGEGPDEAFLRARFANQDRVQIDRFEYADSIKVHLQHDIAVVPSLGSEGTSLSLCEAMAAGCAVVATSVGGMTNMILNDYNGMLIQPNAADLFDALKYLIQNPQVRRGLGRRAYNIAQSTFGVDRWKRAWQRVIDEVQSQTPCHSPPL